MHARTSRSHAPKPKLGEICTVSWRGRERSRTPEPSPRRRLRRTPNTSTRIFGHSSARSNRPDAEREASCTSMASSVSDLPTAVSLPRDGPRAITHEKARRLAVANWMQVVTRLLAAGEPDHVVESITGHLSRRMLEHYSHIRIAAKRAALERLAQSGSAASTKGIK